MDFKIKDYELGGKTTEVTAPGAAEAMLEYLPWPSLEIEIYWQPMRGIYEIIDLKTGFRYDMFVI